MRASLGRIGVGKLCLLSRNETDAAVKWEPAYICNILRIVLAAVCATAMSRNDSEAEQTKGVNVYDRPFSSQI
jgi:hypothetical protein